MKFVIRDDDLNYFSSPDDIKKWYQEIFDMEIPVGFSVIPFVKPSSDVYTNRDVYTHFEIEKEFPISNNKELVKYIRSNNLIEVLQHGCTHQTKNGVFEYCQDKNLIKDTLRGKRELENAFNCDVRIFVPPHDRISNHGIEAIEKARLNIIRGKGFRNFLIRKEYFLNIPKMVLHVLRYPDRTRMPAYPYVLDFGKHKEAYSYRLNDNNLEELLMGLEYVKRKKGNFIVTAHLHDFNEKRKNNLLEIIEKARNLGFKFVKPSALFE